MPTARVCGSAEGQGHVLHVSDGDSSALSGAELGTSSRGCSTLLVAYSQLQALLFLYVPCTIYSKYMVTRL